MAEPPAKKQRLAFEEDPVVKYTKIFINNEWVDSGKSLLVGVLGLGLCVYLRPANFTCESLGFGVLSVQ